MTCRPHIRQALLFALWVTTLPIQAATITIINADGAGEGFNDTTSFTATGGNYATTLGQARLNALQYAANLIAQHIGSAVEIKIYAQMNALGGSGASATLGQAGPTSALRDFSGSTASTWYPVALAEALAGSDLNGTYDVVATFNSDVDNATVLGTVNWYYGLDKTAGTDTDFVTVSLHELLHGLGFLTVMSDAGVMQSGLPDVFLNNLEGHATTPTDFPGMSDAQRLAASTDTGNLHWTGAQVAANLAAVTAGKTSTHVHMFAPSPHEAGSSVSHFSDTVLPDETMEPYYTTPNHSPGLAVYVLADIGWTTKLGSGSADLHLALAHRATVTTIYGQNATYTLTVTNNGSNTAVETTVTYMIPSNHTYQSSATGQGSCTHANQIVSCALGNLAASNATTVDILVNVGSTKVVTHAAIVSSATTEANALDNTVSYETLPVVADSSSSNCFIATAAYGSPFGSEVSALRKFRDQYLLANKPGQLFVDLYYQLSPSVADMIRQDNFIRAMVRGSLGPLVALSYWLGKENTTPEKAD